MPFLHYRPQLLTTENNDQVVEKVHFTQWAVLHLSQPHWSGSDEHFNTHCLYTHACASVLVCTCASVLVCAHVPLC